MSAPNHSILPATAADLATIRYHVRISKLPLAINRFLFNDWPNEPAQIALYTHPDESLLKDPAIEIFKVVDDNTGAIVGHLVLTRKTPAAPGGKEEAKEEGKGEDKRGEKKRLPDGVNPEVVAKVTEMITEIAKEVEGIERLELTHIYVLPSSRNYGIGSQLMQICFDKGKAEGLPVTLSSEPQAYDFYAKRGFKDTKHADVDLSKWAPAHCGYGVFRISGMIWKP